MTKTQEAMRSLARVLRDKTGNLPPLPGIFPDYPAPIVRNRPEGRELVMARWGMPTPAIYLKGKATDRGVTNIRNTKIKHWLQWLGPSNRCLVPFSSFAENEELPDGTAPPAWFAFDETRPLAFFAGIWTNWTGVRKVKEGPVIIDIFGFLTTEPSEPVRTFHPKAMPVILTNPDECDRWMSAPTDEAMKLQRPLPDNALVVIACGSKKGRRTGCRYWIGGPSTWSQEFSAWG